jgi:DNA invertase Pin-like site-specific DNA recombinase
VVRVLPVIGALPTIVLQVEGPSHAGPNCKNVSYAFFSYGQTLAAQDAQLSAAGCAKVYAEKVSGARSDRAELAKLLKRLEPGDVVVVTRLDRLARSTRDLLNILDTVTKAGAQFKSLGDTWADTTTPHGRLILTVLGGLAEFERELIRGSGPARGASGPRNGA